MKEKAQLSAFDNFFQGKIDFCSDDLSKVSSLSLLLVSGLHYFPVRTLFSLFYPEVLHVLSKQVSYLIISTARKEHCDSFFLS
jgi:hypothetical protein